MTVHIQFTSIYLLAIKGTKLVISIKNLILNYLYFLYAEVDGWEYNISRDTRSYIQPENMTTILIPEQFCKNNKTDLLIVITSKPDNFEARKAIRETWASQKTIDGFTISSFFIIGQVLNETLQVSMIIHRY